MEVTTDMSIMFDNDSIVHHRPQPYPTNNNKKFIDESGSEIHSESGYASAASISYNQTATSASISMKRSLEPIAENYELTFPDSSNASMNETPTTRSARQLSEFHIQTPPNDERMQETTPTKANYYTQALRSSQESSNKKNRSLALSPYKGTPNKRNGNNSRTYSPMHLSFMDKMMSTEKHKRFAQTDDSEDIENSFEMSVNDPSIELSPIGHQNKSLTMTTTTSMSMHDGNRRTLQRHPSGIESSTPIHSHSIRRTNTQTVARAQCDTQSTRYLLRKTQSFSPAKRSANILQEISNKTRVPLERHDERLEEDEAAKELNPARKMLEFSTNQFDKLVTGNMPAVVPTSFSQVKASPITPTKLLKPKRIQTLQRQQRFNITPSPPIESPVHDEVAQQSVRNNVLLRPTKKFERSISCSSASPENIPSKGEQCETSIYCTPRKASRRKPLKRPAPSDNVSGNSVEPPAKRKLSYQGVETFDIMTHLQGTGKKGFFPKIVEEILSQLSDSDLYASYQVCSSWSNMIASHDLAFARYLRYARQLERHKENLEANRIATSTATRPRPSIAIDESVKRKPFGGRNVHYSLRPTPPRRSPPVSPSKISFYENQKVVKKLKPNQRLTRCPRCNGNSIIYAVSDQLSPPSTSSPPKAKSSELFGRRKGYSCPMPNTNNNSTTSFASTSKAWKSFDERKKPETVLSEYAECTRLPCGYSFCTNCSGKRHVDCACPQQPISSSPKSDGECSPPPPSNKRTSRRNLRRLLN